MDLLFIDTNIWLDFYRSRNDAGISLLKHIDQIRDNLILTYQVEMEFKKNRQAVILSSVQELKPPQVAARPAIFSNAKISESLKKDYSNIGKRLNTLKAKLSRLLENPAIYDPVYQVGQRCFHHDSPFNLKRNVPARRVVKRRAFRRFIYGAPPRKSGDTSIGDAVNWEWIIECASMRDVKDVHIVSRDADYGIQFEDKSYINDHLYQEFRDRTSNRRKVHLHSKLSQALKHFKIAVTASEEAAENEMAKPAASDSDRKVSPDEVIEGMRWLRMMLVDQESDDGPISTS